MLDTLIGRLFSTSSEKAAMQDTRPRQRDSEIRDENPQAADQEALADSLSEEDADPRADENDWYEYDDEIASAVAFAAHCDEEAAVAADQQESDHATERWEDWAAVAELEDDASYQWGQEEEEEY